MAAGEAGKMLLAAVLYESGFEINDLLAAVANELKAGRVRLGGAIQRNLCQGDGPCSAMVLTDLASGREFGISQDLGRNAQGCRLDPGGLAGAGASLEATVKRAEFLILNKFGKAEAEGGGLRSVFARAIDLGVPVLTAVRPPYAEAWREFHGGLAVDLSPDVDRVLVWCRRAISCSSDTPESNLVPVRS